MKLAKSERSWTLGPKCQVHFGLTLGHTCSQDPIVVSNQNFLKLKLKLGTVLDLRFSGQLSVDYKLILWYRRPKAGTVPFEWKQRKNWVCLGLRSPLAVAWYSTGKVTVGLSLVTKWQRTSSMSSAMGPDFSIAGTRIGIRLNLTVMKTAELLHSYGADRKASNWNRRWRSSSFYTADS
jgi:hypothetical protein